MAGLPDDDNPGALRMTSGVAPARPPRPDRTRSIFTSLEAGVVVGGKYRLVRCLGEGGMATLWVAHNAALDIEVAIKFIRTDLTTPKLAERLLTEARAAAKLGHPAIVRVFDFGETPRGDPYIVMELLDGEDLSSVYVESGRMTPIATLRTLLPIAHALAVAHDKGIVHRDLKPENVFLARAEDGQVQPKLLDFGVAKFDAAGYERLTQAGTALGSPAYMSPEQARGEEVDPRSDLWSFCVVLYEALSGTLPFHHDNYNALMRLIIEIEPTPLTDLAAGDSDLWRIIEKGLAKDVDLRWSSMRGLGAALAQWLIERGVHEDLAGSSLTATWLQARQSWVDSDGVFERVIADSGLHPIASDMASRKDHPSKADTLPPPSSNRETPTAEVRTVEQDDPAPTQPSLPPAGRHPFGLIRNVAISIVALVVIAIVATLLLGRRAAELRPHSETSDTKPAVATDRRDSTQEATRRTDALEVAPAAPSTASKPATRPTARTAPPAPTPVAAAPSAAARPSPPSPEQTSPPPPQPPADTAKPKSGGLEIKTSF